MLPRCGHSLRSAATAYDAPFRHPFDGYFGGFVAKYMGDGVLIYFGYPEAHEDDAERAARAGLAVIDAVGRLATQEPLKVRIGIASGLVVVGDLIGAGAAQERGVVGETPNLAGAGPTGHARWHAVRDRGSRAPIPLADAAARRSRIVLQGEIPSALSPPGGCPLPHTLSLKDRSEL